MIQGGHGLGAGAGGVCVGGGVRSEPRGGREDASQERLPGGGGLAGGWEMPTGEGGQSGGKAERGLSSGDEVTWVWTVPAPARWTSALAGWPSGPEGQASSMACASCPALLHGTPGAAASLGPTLLWVMALGVCVCARASLRTRVCLSCTHVHVCVSARMCVSVSGEQL